MYVHLLPPPLRPFLSPQAPSGPNVALRAPCRPQWNGQPFLPGRNGGNDCSPSPTVWTAPGSSGQLQAPPTRFPRS